MIVKFSKDLQIICYASLTIELSYFEWPITLWIFNQFSKKLFAGLSMKNSLCLLSFCKI